MAKNVSLPTVEDAKTMLCNYINNHLTLLDYKGSKFFGVQDFPRIEIAPGVTAQVNAGLTRIQDTAISQAATAERVNRDFEKLSPADRKAFLEKQLAQLG